MQLSYGMGDPKVGDMATLQHVLRGIKSTQARKGQQPRPRQPITLLGKLRQVWERDGLNKWNVHPILDGQCRPIMDGFNNC